MAHFDDIYDIAADGYGIVAATQAREAGATTGEMNRWCTDGKLLRRGHGVYKLVRWVPTPYDAYAEAVALVGGGAFLWGKSVLAMHGLALVDPRAIEVATPKRVRRKLPSWVETVAAPKGERTTRYEGIPSQRVADAIESCAGSVMPTRLLETAKKARGEGFGHRRRVRKAGRGADITQPERHDVLRAAPWRPTLSGAVGLLSGCRPIGAERQNLRISEKAGEHGVKIR